MNGEIGIRAAARGDEDALSAVGKASFLEAFAGILDGGDIIAHCERQHAPTGWPTPACASGWRKPRRAGRR
jgi:hypothetical protein